MFVSQKLSAENKKIEVLQSTNFIFIFMLVQRERMTSLTVPIPQFPDAPCGIWKILPFAGVNGFPLQGTGPAGEPITPAVPKSVLWGIPYAGTNTGANPDLRIMTLAPADTALNGPVQEIAFGVRAKLFNERLVHKIKWKISPVACTTQTVNIGFYGENYLNLPNGSNSSPLILTPKGPAFFTANRENGFCGSFTFTGASLFYVIVDANIFIELEVSYCVPGRHCPIDYQLFVPVPIYNSDGELIATQEQVDTNPLLLVLRPATQELVDASVQMVSYLEASAVTLYFIDSSGNVLLRKARSGLGVPAPRIYTDVPLLAQANANTTGDAVNFYSQTNGIVDTSLSTTSVLTRALDNENYLGFDLRSSTGDDPLVPSGPVTVKLTIELTFDNRNPLVPAQLYDATTFTYSSKIAIGTISGDSIIVRPDVDGQRMVNISSLGIKKGNVVVSNAQFTFDASQMEGFVIQLSTTALSTFIVGYGVARGAAPSNVIARNVEIVFS